MEKSWLGKMLSRAPKSVPVTVPHNADYTNAEVQFSMGLQLASGEGATKDYAQAAEWYRKAADQNHCLALLNLGTMYANGQGVAKDEAQSGIWFGRAANLGDAGGQYYMGVNCQRASMNGPAAAAPEARIEAYKWYQLSAAQGYQIAEGASATLTIKMTRVDVTEAIQRVANFVVGGKAS